MSRREMLVDEHSDALAEFLAIIEERAGPDWGISTKVALGTETASMAGVKSLAELLATTPPATAR